jgi:alkylated DNA repair dioxygenase AlkB
MKETPDISYFSKFFKWRDSTGLFESLRSFVDWTDTVISESGTPVKLNRKMAYIGATQKPYFYNKLKFETPNGTWDTCHNVVRQDLTYVKNMVETKLDVKFNSVLLNYYKDGKEEIKWHSDKEFCLGDNPVIACVNLGATRKFWVQEKKEKGDRWFYELGDGDLLVMNKNCQENFLHAILKEKEITEPRISLTYRWCND